MHVYTPHGGAGGGRRTSIDAARTNQVDSVEPYACCLAGLVATCVVALLFYPVLVAVTRPLQVLSTTAIMFVLLFVWFLVWSGTEIVWEWRAGRVSFPD